MKEFYAAGGQHPLKGIGHSAEARAKMSRKHKGQRPNLSPEQRRRYAEHCKRVLNNPIQVEKTRAINKARCGSKSHSYGRSPAHAKKVWHTKPDGTRVCLRSRWEGRFAAWLDATNIAWTYETEAFPINVLIDGKLHEATYRPDFITHDMIYEVKGRWLPDSKAKFDAFLRQFPERPITIVDRQWLKSRGLL